MQRVYRVALFGCFWFPILCVALFDDTARNLRISCYTILRICLTGWADLFLHVISLEID